MNDASRARALVEAVTSRPGYTRWAGTTVELAEPGRVHMSLRRRPDLVQFNGFFHGGVIAGLADHAAGGAVTTLMPESRIGVTVDLHVNFLAPANGDEILAKAEAIQVGKTIAVAAVEVVTNVETEQRQCAFCVVTLRAVEMESRH